MATRKKTGRARVPRDGSRPHEVHYVPRVVVKSRDDVQLPYKDGMEKWLEAQHVGARRELAPRYPGIRMRRLFNSVKPARLAAMVEEARNCDRTYRPPNFFTYLVIDCPAADPEKLALDLREWPAVENAYFDPPGEDPVVNPGDDPRSPNQGYLDGEP